MSSPITVQLSLDEALVLIGFFGRFEQDGIFRLRNNAEFVAFSKVSGQLEKSLESPLGEVYAQNVEAARLRLAGGYQGIAPGVEPTRNP
jgi:hypothetical protein